jgi:hypothetical protein
VTEVVNRIADVRDSLSAQARVLLDHVWKYRKKEGRWPASTDVRIRLRSELDVRNVVDELGGSVIEEHPPGGEGPATYRLTTVGILLTRDGPHVRDALCRYLEYVSGRLAEERQLVDIPIREITKLLGPERAELLRLVVFGDHGYPWNSGGGNAPGGYFGRTEAFEHLLDVPQVGTWVDELVSSRYRLGEPVDVRKRELRASVLAPKSEEHGFNFVVDTELRRLLESDYRELEGAREVHAWKACVILAGSLVEGMLLDAVRQDPTSVQSLLKRYKSLEPVPTAWKLDDIVRTAKETGIIRSSSAALGDVVRVFRNVVHPARQMAEKMPATKELAESARSTMHLLRMELSDRAKKSP